MKAKTIVLAAIGAACVGIGLCSASLTNDSANHKEVAVPEQRFQYDGMHFNAAYVVETFYYGESAYYMVYDNLDAGCDFEVIRLDKRTFDAVEEAVAKRQFPCTGTLKGSKPYESVEYSIKFDEWRRYTLPQYSL